ncbi:hypothetical protein BDY21DRAFT_340204 [Lineolata rhizophorae]|uniref:Uncharacterized protein n=1 Tax=Lineolata rhizophorae TaxID=578093 RepID=A0A6A6P5Y5_9PEZI|nr:hypothetical protein BDY21DRAFT_340204 [Lineolata rhizophorae]
MYVCRSSALSTSLLQSWATGTFTLQLFLKIRHRPQKQQARKIPRLKVLELLTLDKPIKCTPLHRGPYQCMGRVSSSRCRRRQPQRSGDQSKRLPKLSCKPFIREAEL